MGYVLEQAEPLGPGLRRILMEETVGAAEGLERASEADWEEAVHEARKSLKKSRAIVRLTRSAMDPSTERRTLSSGTWVVRSRWCAMQASW
jgi:hypothetical protein